MKSDVIAIDSTGAGFADAVDQARKVADYCHLTRKDALHLELMTEEMLSLVRSITGEMQASFWIETDGHQYDLHLTARTEMDKEKRHLLLSSSTSGKNEAARSFLGYLRNALEQALTADVDYSYSNIPMDLLHDLPSHPMEAEDWDGYEQSVLKKVADNIRMAIRGEVVDMTVSRQFAN